MISALRILFIFHWCSWIFWRNFNCSAIVPEGKILVAEVTWLAFVCETVCVSRGRRLAPGKLRSVTLNHYWTNAPSFCLEFEHMTGFTAFWCYYEKYCVLPILLISIFSDVSLEDYSSKCWKFCCRYEPEHAWKFVDCLQEVGNLSFADIQSSTLQSKAIQVKEYWTLVLLTY